MKRRGVVRTIKAGEVEIVKWFWKKGVVGYEAVKRESARKV